MDLEGRATLHCGRGVGDEFGGRGGGTSAAPIHGGDGGPHGRGGGRGPGRGGGGRVGVGSGGGGGGKRGS